MNEDLDKDKMCGKCLKVFDLPDRITEAELRQIFSNEKKNGGGPIHEMIMYSNNEERYAIITFEDIDAVRTIMIRGNTVPVLDRKLRVEPFLKSELNLLKCQPILPVSETKEKIEMKSVKQNELIHEDKYSSLLSQSNLDDEYSDLHSLSKPENEYSYLQSKPHDEVLHSHSEVEPNDNFTHLHSEVKSEMVSLNTNSEVKYEMTSLNSNSEIKSEMIPLNSNSEIKSEMIPLNSNLEVEYDVASLVDNDVLKRTIKAGISKGHLSKKYYELYLDDIGLKNYDSHSMMLDGLHKNFYVTFNEEADAQKFCQMCHDTEKSNITNVTLTTESDFNTYNNRIFLLGLKIPPAEKLKKLLKEKTEIDVKEIIENRELNAVVIIFNEKMCMDITPLTWELSNLNGVKMITAPVIRENALLVSGLNGIPKFLLERYMKNKKHSGGGPLKSVELIGDNQALVIFESEADLENFTHKGSHELEDRKLEVTIYHSCLQQTYLQKWISDQEIKELNKIKTLNNLSSDLPKSNDSELTLSSQSADKISSELPESSKSSDHMLSEIPESSKRNDSYSRKKRTGLDKTEAEKEIQLKPEEYFLLEKNNIFKQIKQKDLKLVLDQENNKIILRGADVSSLANMEIEIFKFCKNNIENICLNDLLYDAKKFIELEKVREKLNSILLHGYLKCSSGELELFFLKSEDPKNLISVLKKHTFIQRKELNSESFSALQSFKGQMFLAGIEINSNLKSFVNFDADEKTIVILGPEKEILDIEREINNFVDNFITEKVEFPEGKIIFACNHLQKEINNISFDTETEMKSVKNYFIISGFKEDVEKCKIRLKKICNKISRELLSLKFDGVNEFMKDPKGQSMLQNLEVKNKCVIMFNNESSPSKQERAAFKRFSSQDSIEQAVAVGERNEKLKEVEKNSQVKVNIGKLEVSLEEGEIDNQTTDMIVITVDKSLDLRKRRISKILLEKAGEQIQQELKSKKKYDLEPGEFARTHGGRLQCNYIIYACLSPLKDPVDSSEYKKSLSIMKKMIVNIMHEAHSCNVKSISIPSLGTGHLGYPPSTSAKVIVDAINEFSSKFTNSPLRKVKLVIFPTDRDVMKAFRPVVLSKGKDTGSSFDDSMNAVKESKNRQYGDINHIIEQGDITKESQCEAIVISIKDSMSLLLSGKVSSALYDVCGHNLQQECYKKKDEIKQNGIVMTSAPGLKCKKIFFISQEKFSTHWDEGILQVLKEADRTGIKTLALPALGAGFRQGDLKKVKNSISTAIEKFSRCQRKRLNLIKLVIFDKKTLDFFLKTDQEVSIQVATKDKQSDARLDQRKLSVDVIFDVYSDDKENIAATQSALEEICQKHFTEKLFQNDCIHLLNKNDVEELESFGLLHRIKICIYLDDDKIIAKGFNHDGIQEVRTKIKEILKKFEANRGVKNRAKEPSIVWQFEKQDGWHNFEPLLNCELEQEYMKGSPTHIITDVKRESYLIDFIEFRMYTMDHSGNRLHPCHDIQRNCKQSVTNVKEAIDKVTDKKMPAEPPETEKGAQYTLKEPIIIWQYKDKDQWNNFSSWFNQELEERSKKSLRFNIKTANGESYAVDLQGMQIFQLDLGGNFIQCHEIQRSCI